MSSDLTVPFTIFDSTKNLSTTLQSTLELTHSDADFNTYSLVDSNGDIDIKDNFFSLVSVKFDDTNPIEFKISHVGDFLDLHLDFQNLTILENDGGTSLDGAHLYVEGDSNGNKLAVTLARILMQKAIGANTTNHKLRVSKIMSDITTNFSSFLTDTNSDLDAIESATRQTITNVLNDGDTFTQSSSGLLGQLATSLKDIYLYLLATDSNFIDAIHVADGDFVTYSPSTESPTLSISYNLTITYRYKAADDSSAVSSTDTIGVKIFILEPSS